MITHFNKGLLIIFLILFSLISQAQSEEKVNELEKIYQSGNYLKTYKKANKLLDRPEYDIYNEPTMFMAMALFQLSQNDKYKDKTRFKDGFLESIRLMEEFKEIDFNGHTYMLHYEEIFNLKDDYIEYIKVLAKSNKEKAKEHYSLIKELFDDNTSIEKILIEKDAPEKDTSPIVIITKNDIPDKVLRDSIIDFSKTLLGVPYKWGGQSKEGFDCSGFAQYVMAYHGLKIPRVARIQYDKTKKIDFEKARKGDLVFFGKSTEKITHVGIITSNPGEELTMIHASSSKGIMISNIKQSNYWKERLLHTCNVIDK